MVIIDAQDMIVGRLAAHAAKQALLGENVEVVNCENAVMSGNKNTILAKYKNKRAIGRPTKGPFYFRSPDRFVRRIIRGMLPYKQPKGAAAFKRVMCHVGVPEQFKDQEIKKVEKAHSDKLPTYKFITIKDICKSMGGKV